MVTERECRSAIWGKKAYVMVQGIEVNVQIPRKEALWLFEASNGDLAWSIDGNDITLSANAEEMYGQVGLLRV